MAIINRHPALQGKITLQTVDDIGPKVPLLVDLKPSSENYMTEFHNAGGMLALLHTLRPLLHLEAMALTGMTLGETLDATPFRTFPVSSEVIRPLPNPLYQASSLVVLYGNLAQSGAVIKAAASKDQRLLRHSGPACVFENSIELAERIDTAELQVNPDSVLVLKSIGPIGNPGMPEAGVIPIPRKLAAKGVKDMLRISDGRMSGTAGGTIVLHVSPESARPESVFAIVRSGDIVTCDVEKRRLKLEISDKENQKRVSDREAELKSKGEDGQGLSEPASRRGYRGLYRRRVNQAHEGADFDFLTASGPKEW
jgi:dihydroxy-acid dehydratase